MAKTLLKDATHDELLDELKNRLAPEEGGEEGSEPKQIKIPSPAKLEKMDEDALQDIAAEVGIETDGKDEDELRALLTTFSYIGSSETDDLDAKDVKALCLELGLKPSKDKDENVQAVVEYMEGDNDAADEADADADSDDEEDADKSDDDDEDKSDGDDDAETADDDKSDDDDDEDADKSDDDDDDKSDDSDDDSDESNDNDDDKKDTAAIVKKKGKYPKDALMQKRIDAFNKVAKNKIDAKKLGLKKAYSKLLERLVTDDEEIAEWGTPYVRDGAGWNCGLEMKDTKLKGDKTDYGKCLVTGKLFSLDDEGSFVEKED